MAHHCKVDCLVKRLDCSVMVKVKVTERFRIPVNVHLNDISSAAESSVTKFGMVMHHNIKFGNKNVWWVIRYHLDKH